MKISVVSSILADYSLDESLEYLSSLLEYLSSLGVEQFELGVGGYPGKAHADALVLSRDESARRKLLSTFERHNMTISALAVHGNCVHPDKATAQKFEDDFRAACVLAGQIGVDRIVTFSGCPGSRPHSHLFGLPGFRPAGYYALLGDLRMAARISPRARMAVERGAHSRMAVERGAHSLLAPCRGVCRRKRSKAHSARNAPRFLRIQSRHLP